MKKNYKVLLLGLSLLLAASGIWAQPRMVSGTVTDAVGNPLIGAVVSAANASGAITDASGNFSISAAGDAVLTVSLLGFSTQEVAVNNRSVVNVVMTEDTQAIDEVVVIGYGTMRKKDLTGSIVQVRPDAIANENPNTVQDILRGTPGLAVGYDASAKGGGSMQIRGQRSLYTDGGHNDPLIILDGMAFYGELSEINPDDIGQIDILKDASAAAIYGAKAATGVVIITTKRGKMGKPVVNVTANVGIVQKSAYREVFSADEYMRYREDWYKTPTYGMSPDGVYGPYQTSGSKPGQYDHPSRLPSGVSLDTWRGYTTNQTGESDESIYAKRLQLSNTALDNYLAGRSFDWFKHTFQLGLNQDYNASVSGANDRVNYYLSLGYLRNEGAVRGNLYNTIRANMKVDAKVTDWFEIGANVNFQDRSDGDIQPGLGTNYWDENEIRNSPYASYRDENGELEVHPMGDSHGHKGYNYDFNRQFIELEKGYQVLNTIITAKVNLPFGITYSFNGSPRFQYFYDRYFTSARHPDWVSTNGSVNREQSKRFDWSLNNTINWDKTFGDKHHFVVTLVQEAEQRRSWMDRIEARNLQPSDALGFHNTAVGDKSESSFRSSDTNQTADALLARLFYSYDDRYMLTASIRRDGYSAFGANNPYATFPAVALAWNFTNESFFNWRPMSMGKLRISWGKNGNRSLADPYVALADLTVPSGTQGYIVGNATQQMKYLRVNRLANPGLQWEKTAALNLGLDFGFLNDRITGTFEWYSMTTHDMIMRQPLPNFSGFGEITTNLGEIRNTGFDFSISSLNMRRENFEWRTSFTLSYNRSIIKHLFYEYDENGKERDYTPSTWFIGKDIDVIWDYRVTGIWQVDEVEEAAKYGNKPGDIKVANNPDNDVYDDAGNVTRYVYNDDDKEFLGRTRAPFNWTLRNDFTLFKNLTLGINIYSFMGHKRTEGLYINEDNGGSLITYGLNTFKKEYWTPDNPTNKYARLDAQGPDGKKPGRIYDRSFIRLENITLGYTLPTTWTQKFEIERLKVFATVRNPAVWAFDWEYGDPETRGLATRVYTFGVNVTF
jgi:TonB-linked SusC/RagA family outer membrane protein